jgi:hypothetical protein
MERVKGIEPSYSAWKAAALPLSYTRNLDDESSRKSSAKQSDAAGQSLGADAQASPHGVAAKPQTLLLQLR